MSEQRTSDIKIPNFINQNFHVIKIAIIGTIVFASLFFLVKLFRDTQSYFAYIAAIAQIASHLVDVFGIEHELKSASGTVDDTIVTAVINVYWTVGPATDGLLVIAMVAAALFAMPGQLLHKLFYILLCISLFFLLTPINVAMGVVFEQHLPLNQDLLINYLLPLMTGFIPIIISLFVWYQISKKT